MRHSSLFLFHILMLPCSRHPMNIEFSITPWIFNDALFNGYQYKCYSRGEIKIWYRKEKEKRIKQRYREKERKIEEEYGIWKSNWQRIEAYKDEVHNKSWCNITILMNKRSSQYILTTLIPFWPPLCDAIDIHWVSHRILPSRKMPLFREWALSFNDNRKKKKVSEFLRWTENCIDFFFVVCWISAWSGLRLIFVVR